MTIYKELDPELVRKMIEGYEDALTPEAKGLEALYRQFSCPRCREELQKEFDSRHVYSNPDSLVGRALLRCGTCGYLIDPFTGLVLEFGNPAKIPLEVIPGADWKPE